MNRLSILLSIWLLLLPCSPLQAQSSSQSPNPTTLLERAEAALYRQGASILDFSTQLRDKAGRHQGDTSGKLHLQGDAFRLEYGTITAVYASGTLTYYDSAEQTLTISTPSQEELLQINPLHFLRSRARGYQSKLQSTTASHASVLFVPQSKQGNIAQILVTFQRAGGLPAQLVFSAKDKSQLTAKVARITHRSAYPASFFQLREQDYPGCEVVDLR